MSLHDTEFLIASLRDHEKKASIFQKLGAYYKNLQSKYELALSNSQKALEIFKRLFPGDHQDKATSYNTIGSI